MLEADEMHAGGEPVDRQKVHRVHQDHPHENSERQANDKLAVALREDVFNLSVDKVIKQFKERLRLARHAGGDFARDHVEHSKRDHAEQH